MLKINPNINMNHTNRTFSGVNNNTVKKAGTKVAKELSSEVRAVEYAAGMNYAATVKDELILSETVLREMLLGHIDFVKGIFEHLKHVRTK